MMKIGRPDFVGNPGDRDAFHVAAVLVTSEQPLQGGFSVRFTDRSFSKVESCHEDNRHAIVDPFLKAVPEGTPVWVLLIPGSVQKLTHKFDLEITDLPEAGAEPEEEEEYDSCKGCW